jgi:perosamine synthetase
MSKVIPLLEPHLGGNEWQYIRECLDDGWVSTSGKYVERFESEICKVTGAKFAVACVNGTSALHVALKISGVGAGDEVIVPTVTFIAPVNAIRYVQAEPVFMDCDRYYDIDILKTIDFLEKETVSRDGSTQNKRTGRRIAAIIPVHVFGNAVNLQDLTGICRERNIAVVEDASESLGTIYSSGSLIGKHTGTIGDVGCLSFNANKIVTTGGGGMIITDNSRYAERAKYLTTQAKDDDVRYYHGDVGYNYRLTNIQAALGVAQLEQLPKFLARKRTIYEMYERSIKAIGGLRIADTPEYARNNHWMCALQIEKAGYGRGKEELLGFLGSNGIQARPVWYPNHLQKPYKNSQVYRIETAYEVFDATLNLPCSVGLEDIELQTVVSCLDRGKCDKRN